MHCHYRPAGFVGIAIADRVEGEGFGQAGLGRLPGLLQTC